MIDQTVLESKRLGVCSCSEDASLLDVASRMVDEDVSALAVVNHEGHLVGIISRTDLLAALVSAPDWPVQFVKNFMNRDVVTVSPLTPLVDVAKILLQEHIHRVVVVKEEDGNIRPVSVVSAADIVYHMAKWAE